MFRRSLLFTNFHCSFFTSLCSLLLLIFSFCSLIISLAPCSISQFFPAPCSLFRIYVFPVPRSHFICSLIPYSRPCSLLPWVSRAILAYSPCSLITPNGGSIMLMDLRFICSLPYFRPCFLLPWVSRAILPAP